MYNKNIVTNVNIYLLIFKYNISIQIILKYALKSSLKHEVFIYWQHILLYITKL